MRTLRWTGAVVLLVISSLLVVASVTARFARAELLNTDRYVETVAPLASDPDVQEAITRRVTDAVMNSADLPALIQQLAEATGIKAAPQAATLAAPAITNWIKGQVQRIVGDLVTSPQFATLWTEVNRSAHTQIEKLLTGKDGTVVSTQDTDIVINLGPVVTAAKDNLVARGWGFLSKVPDVSIPYTVATIDNLPEIQRYVKLLDKAGTWLPILALILLGLGVWCAPNHRRGLLVGLLISAVLLLLTLAAYAVFRNRYAEKLAAKGFNTDVALTVWDQLLRYLVIALATTTVAAALAAIWVYLAGPGRGATLFRRGVNSAIDPVGRAIGPQPGVRRFVRRWQPWIAVVFAAGAMWWLLASPTVATAFLIVAVVALLTAVITLLRRLPA
ncbi:MAG: hypothetical protein HOV71_29455 [Hamadaea sp.]|nr:hypothetical protein [Hamadaea sp.]NUT03625.1 hypothetical protein [Hamadaea sp.]